MTHDKKTGPAYWRSLDELTRTPEFQEAVQREFPGDDWDRLPAATRRQFLQVMGASLAMAGLTACRWPKEEIVPFAHRPEGRTPGVPEYYATSMELGGAALGMLVTSFDGRPIKAEGNELHPDSLGALTAIAQADILQLYDPDRSRRLLFREGGQQYVKGWSDFETAIAEYLSGDGTGVAVLAESSSSPTRAMLRDRFLEAQPQAGWFDYEPISWDNEREGTRLLFGSPLRAHPQLEKASVVACFGADPLFDHPSSIRLARQFAAARDPETGAGARLYVAENSFSLTGVRADHRVAVAAKSVPAVLARVAHVLVAEHHLELPAAAAGYAGAVEQAISIEEMEFADTLAADLANHKGAGVILVGRRQEPAVHALAAVLNLVLGANGSTVDYTADTDPDRGPDIESIAELAAAMKSGSIQTLLILGGNPVYNAPADLGFAEHLANVPVSIHLSLYDDETSKKCTWHLPQAHGLESWDTGRAWDGTLTMRQPLIRPLFEGRSSCEVLALAAGSMAASGYELTREYIQSTTGAAEFEIAWRRALHDGVVADTSWPAVVPRLDPGRLAVAVDAFRAILDVAPASADRPEVVLTADSRVWDGRFANNGWLQELPDALTKVTWDNALLISPATARDLGIDDGELVAIEAGGRTVEAPAVVLPGQARSSVSLALGYGRTAAGQVGNGVGVDAFVLRRADSPSIVPGATLRGTGRRYNLATTQDHFAIDTLGFAERNRRVGDLVREASLDAYLANPEVFHEHEHHPPLVSLWKDQQYEGEQWGMSIDLNTCIGCNACVVACQAENNIPVVGREQVLNQREMHWIRIDRYFKTDAGVRADEIDSAEVVFQPGLPGGCHSTHHGRPQRHGLQPVCGHAVLLEQLSVQSEAIQLFQLPQGARRYLQDAVQP
jgi:molybdopterin-containing oxidoreductase family iron-sulfur binding subunit